MRFLLTLAIAFAVALAGSAVKAAPDQAKPDQVKAKKPDQAKPDQVKAKKPDQVKVTKPDQVKVATPDQVKATKGKIVKVKHATLKSKLARLKLFHRHRNA